MVWSRAMTLLVLGPSLGQALSFPRPTGLPSEIGLPPDSDSADACPNYADCSTNGHKYWNSLHETLLDPQAVDRSIPPNLFEEHYVIDVVPSLTIDSELRQGLIKRAIDISHIDLWRISSNNSETKVRDPEPAYSNLIYTYHGFISAEGNWRAKDSQKKLQWSEVIYQTWKMAEKRANELAAKGKRRTAGGSTLNLKSVVRHSITNKGTQDVVRAAYKSNPWTPEADGPEDWHRFSETERPAFFEGLLGTEKVKGLLWLLKDHAVEIGRKEPSVVWTRWMERN
ncbi:MAG: hypothetical protein Q9221_007775 [Calogaya cf. arnoldii]